MLMRDESYHLVKFYTHMLEVKGNMIYSFLNVFQKLSKNLALKIVKKSTLTLGQDMPSVHMEVNHSFGFLTNIL